MKISEKVIDSILLDVSPSAAKNDGTMAAFLGRIKVYEMCEKVIQAYLSDAWIEFDKDDCNLDMAEYRLCRTNESSNGMEMLTYSGSDYWWDYECVPFYNVTHYLDPADIMPEEKV